MAEDQNKPSHPLSYEETKQAAAKRNNQSQSDNPSNNDSQDKTDDKSNNQDQQNSQDANDTSGPDKNDN
ncbi:hypothetical protein Q757_10245 [Oenococcus alcoholitolerans]|uniref:Uncharacterized protein n=1 Tax=Oenococcus alcoholitolerans TaxID=931074 RepID=A0ABR4XNG4_9LACO|nr:hypothetical protein Q757_10245 [Oenococcus alcoholitolerans]